MKGSYKYILNKESRSADKGWSSSLGVGGGANKSSRKNKLLKKDQKKLWTWTVPSINDISERK
jgi:hypothetical protein